MKDLVGLTNALTDILIRVKDEDIEQLKIVKGATVGFSHINQEPLYEIVAREKPFYYPAGSTANIIFNASKLGLDTLLLGSLGNDDIGENYSLELKKRKIQNIFNKSDGRSGRVYVLITPDGERTQITNIGVAGDFNFDFSSFPKTEVFHTSGYEFASDPDKTKEIINYFKAKGAKISFDLAAESVVAPNKKMIEEILKKIDILFMTEEEAKELTDKSSTEALEELAKICPVVALKRGARGSVVRAKAEEHEISTYSTHMDNTCGAGDAYSSGFLFAYIKQFPIEECGRFGSFIASRVCANEMSHF